MAAAKWALILKRVREVCEDGAGSLRSISSSRFLGDSPEGLSDDAAMARAIVKPRVEASITSIRPSEATPPVIGSIRIYDVELSVKVTRVVTPLEQMSDDDRDVLFAACAEDGDLLGQALGYPGNLTTTTAGTATDIVSGVAVHTGSKITVRRQIDDGAQPVESTHTFLVRALARPAV